MTHLFKVSLQFADMFISKLDFESQMIQFQIRDKETGVTMESESHVKFIVNELDQKIYMGSRFIDLRLALLISTTLNS